MTATQPAVSLNFSARTHTTAYSCMLCFSICVIAKFQVLVIMFNL
jgi:hypothetical protein